MKAKWFIGFIITLALVCAVLAVVFNHLGTPGDGLYQETQYDLATLLQFDPSRVIYDEIQPAIETGLSPTRVIAVDSQDRIYVTSGKTIHVFSPSGEKLAGSITLDQDLSALTVAPDGTLYAGLSDHIQVLDNTGRSLQRWASLGPKAVITSIQIWKDHVFVADSGNRLIHHFNMQGEKLKSFGDFVIPSFYFDLAVAGENRLNVAHTGKHRLETYDFEGNLISWWGDFSMTEPDKFSGCCNPVNFALLPDHQGFITCEKGITRVKIYNSEGDFGGYVAAPNQFTTHDVNCVRPDSCFSPVGLDVAIDSNGRVLVLDPAQSKIRIFTRKPDVVSLR